MFRLDQVILAAILFATVTLCVPSCDRLSSEKFEFTSKCKQFNCKNGKVCMERCRQFSLPACVEPKIRSCEKRCPSESRPICASDGHTYHNECELERLSCMLAAKVEKVHEGKCDDNKCSPCPKIMCPKLWDPVCGSDGVTYSNGCLLEKSKCGSFEELKQVYVGKCSANDSVTERFVM